MKGAVIMLLVLLTSASAAPEACAPDIPDDLELGCIEGKNAVRSPSAKQVLIFDSACYIRQT